MLLKQSTFITGWLLFIACLVTLPSNAQQRQLREANNLIEAELYDETINVLKPLVKENHPEAMFLTGFSMLNNHNDMDKAIKMLERATNAYPPLQENTNNSQESLEAHFFLAQALHLNEETKKAREKFENLKKFTNDEEVLEEIERELQYCDNFLKLIDEPVEMKTEHLGEVLNSRYDDHSPIVRYDESTVYFTSNRPMEEQDLEDPFFENIYQSHWRNGQWTKPEILDIPGDPMAHRATVGLTPDGQGLIFFQNDGQTGSLYITRQTFDGWTEPEPLPEPINSNYHEAHASFSRDGSTIYFSSDRPGGMGGSDIYISHKMPDGTWGEPLNAGKNINTPDNEEGPFIHPDDETLYFSSDGDQSIGGFDIFKSKKQENGEWGKTENIGYPINTPADDLFYIPTPNGQRVYYATQRRESLGRMDLFLLRFPETSERSMAVVASHIFKSNNEVAKNAVVRIINPTTNEQLGVYRVNPNSGKFVAIVPTSQKYELTIECEGHKSYHNSFNLKSTDDYKTKNRAIYLPSVTLKEK